MKKLFLLLALLGMVATGCSKDEGGSKDNIPENIFFGLDKESVAISSDGGSVDVIVYSNYKWNISGTSDWCTPSAKSGDANEDGQKVTFSADTAAYDDREATFWFRCADKQIKFIVWQKSNNVIIYYTSSNDEIVQPNDSSVFGATIISNTYIDGVGAIEFTAPITTIGKKAFYNCSSLTSITIPDSVMEIGAAAFSGCSSLQEFKSKFASEDGRCLIVDGTLNAFAPAGLTGYTIPESVTTIGNYTFRGCGSLTSVTIPDSVTEIGEGVFYSCDSLTSITIPDSVTTIGNYAFYGCTSLTSVTIGNSVTTIGSSAFYGCSNLTSVTIGDSVTTIGSSAFEDCSSLTSVNIPDSVTTIGNDAFFGCRSLTSVTIPDSVTTIGDWAFGLCDSLTSVTIPDGVTSIGNDAFNSCSSLTSVTIGDSVTKIGNYAFYYCNSLTSVTIPDSVTTIGEYTFGWCDSLTSVTIPDSVTSIGNSAFEDCNNLTSVYCKATTPPTITLDETGYWNAFDYNASGRKIYVPMESVEAYKSASGWSGYKSYIVGYNF